MLVLVLTARYTTGSNRGAGKMVSVATVKGRVAEHKVLTSYC